ncbi:MAG: DUF192 domain-containing protein [Candidatus Zambryskibacteria bacterium]|nr:DUF192 domain-containing protein [Candidatus Zambryskibacteria bacterium]
MKNAFFLIIGLIFIGGSIYLVLKQPVLTRFNLVQISDKIFKVEVADTDAKRVQGLSGRDNLPEDSGMLFVFDKPGAYGFWMKDMKFSLDIAWLGQNKEILWIERAVSPDTYPQVFYSPRDTLYVLEIPAGSFEKLGVDIGDEVFPR